MAYTYKPTPPYRPGQKEPYKISRSKIELYKQCPRCFWLDARMKIKRPDSPPLNLNKAIDQLLKKEFDVYRANGQPHPIMIEHQINAVPFQHADLDKWRENFVGVGHLHAATNLFVFGAVDDIWVNEDGELIVVDYKATAKSTEVSIDAAWQISYKRQMEIYQWLLRKNGFKVSPTGIFVYTNGRLDLSDFSNKLEFMTKLIAYNGNDEWIEDTLTSIKSCLEGDIPEVGQAAMGGVCDFCSYAKSRTKMTLNLIGVKSK